MSLEGLWPYALDRYGRPGAAPALLSAQDQHAQCVPYLLWALWLADRGCGVDAGTLASGVAIARAWQDVALTPLRGLRRELKTPLSSASEHARERLRDGVSQLELEAERMLLDMLEAASPEPGDQPVDAAAVLAAAAAAWGAELPASLAGNIVKLTR